MSNLESRPEETVCGGTALLEGERSPEVLEPREVPLGGPRAMLVQRTLPHKDRRMIGAWCFVDHYGPHDVTTGPGMQVPPHPHTGLQTVSWLLEGEVLHRDSLGNVQLIRPGQLNLMTSGRGISHSEQSPAERSGRLHGIQLWVALPDADRRVEPWFTHHADLPIVALGTATARVIMGSYAGARSDATIYTRLVAAEVTVPAGDDVRLPLEVSFEHGILALSDGLTVDGTEVRPGSMMVFDPGRAEAVVAAPAGGRVLLIGGEPFEEELVMWWNFVARSHEEIIKAREDWEAGREFGEVRWYPGDRLAAPPMPSVRLRPRPRMRQE